MNATAKARAFVCHSVKSKGHHAPGDFPGVDGAVHGNIHPVHDADTLPSGRCRAIVLSKRKGLRSAELDPLLLDTAHTLLTCRLMFLVSHFNIILW